MAPMLWPDHGIKPQAIQRCKTTYIHAWGRAEGVGATATVAVRNALANARAEIALAVADARALRCPTAGGCPTVCEDRGIVRVGKGIDRNIPVKRAGLWTARAWGFESFERRCYCPPG